METIVIIAVIIGCVILWAGLASIIFIACFACTQDLLHHRTQMEEETQGMVSILISLVITAALIAALIIRTGFIPGSR
jgi:ribose/xylose/arabinose/galactoside ABC-type transport system permease subunit